VIPDTAVEVLCCAEETDCCELADGRAEVEFTGTVVALKPVTSPCAFGGANHHKVITPTGNVYVACIPRNSIVAVTGTGFHVMLALSSQFITTSE